MSAGSSNSSSKKTTASLPLVPEAVLRKRHDLDALSRKRAAAAIPTKKARKLHGKRAVYVKKPETFLARATSRRNHEIRYRRVSKKGMQTRASQRPVTAVKEVSLPDHENDETTTMPTTVVTYQANSVGAPLVFCVRIRDHIGEPRSVRRALSRLRLRNIHEGVFLRYTESTRKALHLVEPWVVYGQPSEAVVNDLVRRRGFGKVDGKRVALSNNVTIEDALGDQNIICVEDLVHEISHVGANFRAAASFLWPFRLLDSKSPFERQILKLKDGKAYGDQGEAINEYIQQVL
jgi:large subunit ribosomal protein L7e